MKNQNDIIGIIVAVLIAAIGIGVIFATKPADKPKESVSPVATEDVDTPASSVVMVSVIPGNSSSPAGMGGGNPMAGMMGGGRPMMSGMPGGMSGMPGGMPGMPGGMRGGMPSGMGGPMGMPGGPMAMGPGGMSK